MLAGAWDRFSIMKPCTRITLWPASWACAAVANNPPASAIDNAVLLRHLLFLLIIACSVFPVLLLCIRTCRPAALATPPVALILCSPQVCHAGCQDPAVKMHSLRLGRRRNGCDCQGGPAFGVTAGFGVAAGLRCPGSPTRFH